MLPLALLAAAAWAAPVVLPRAYAHNDYEHARPLSDALDRGFFGVEADVHLRGRELLIGHTGGDIEAGVTLQSLYLDPLLARVRANKGSVYPGGPKGFLLMVEFKSDADESYLLLRDILRKYQEMLTVYYEDRVVERAVTVVITGHKPTDLLRQEPVRWAGIDGDLGDLDAPEKTLYPTISDSWPAHFTWRDGRVDEATRAKLSRVVAQAHAKGRRLRFYGIPDRVTAWQLMHRSGVDLINTDDLEGLRTFLTSIARVRPSWSPREALGAPSFDGAALTAR